MKIIKREFKVYSFKELSREAKDKAMEDWNYDDELEFLQDDMQYKVEDLLKENKIEGDLQNVFYSLNNCQGDGAMFEGDFKWKGYFVDIVQSGHYNHYNSKTITICDHDGEAVDDKIDKEFDDLYVEICKKLEKYGYDVIETAQGEENLKEMFEANDHWFLENGEMFN